MAFLRANFSPVGGQAKKGSAPCIWSYTTPDAKTVVDAAGYFNDVSGDLSIGDIIYSWATNAGTQTASWHVVVSNASGVCDVSDGNVMAVTDSR